MSLTEERSQFLEAYLNGDVDENSPYFKKLFESEEHFKEALEKHEVAQEIIFELGVKQEIELVQRAFEKKNKAVLPVRYMVAAAIVVIIAVCAVLFAPSKNPLFEDYFTPYPSNYAFRSTQEEGQSEVTSNLEQALRYYSEEDFESAVLYFRKVQSDSMNVGELFFFANTLLAVNEFEQAEAKLQSIVDNQENPFWQQTRWYLAITYLKLERMEETQAMLGLISLGEYRYEEAQKIINKITN